MFLRLMSNSFSFKRRFSLDSKTIFHSPKPKIYLYTRRLYKFDTVPVPYVKIDVEQPNRFYFDLQVNSEQAGSVFWVPIT